MNLRRSLITCLTALAGLGAALALQAWAQNPARREVREETYLLRRPDGTYEARTQQVPLNTPDGGTVLLGGLVRQPLDEESKKLLAEEQAQATEVRRLTNNLLGIEGTPEAKQAEWKSQIREKLAAIFDLQQQRRTREIGKIEERLAKLKDVLKKRDTAKDEIVDRRLNTLTGGVDELGWQESLPLESLPLAAPPSYDDGVANPYNPYAPPAVRPRSRSANPLAPPPPATAPAPPANPVIPGVPDSGSYAPPPVAPSPAPASPAAPRR